MRWALLLGGTAGLLAMAMMNPGETRRRFNLLEAKLDPSSFLKRLEAIELRVDNLERRG